MEINRFFPEIHGNFGFGCMRLPMNGDEVNCDDFCRMADEFIAAGFNYFDTAHGYINGKSETAFRDCVAKRHDRSEFLLTDKLTEPYFNKQEDIRPFVLSQLELCGVDYFDFYLMHAQDSENYAKFKECRAYETCSELKDEGLIRHLGISFHDTADVLDMILTEHPEIEIVQIQYNYVDYEDPVIQSRMVYEVCEKHGKPVIVMEPVKGGNLVNLPDSADKVLRDLGGSYSNAGYAVRYAASKPNMAMVLSGMSNMEQMTDNINVMREFSPVDERELAAVGEVCRIFRSMDLIPCTRCRYCIEENHCPMNILIPAIFTDRNNYARYNTENVINHYNMFVAGDGHGKASDCIKCGMCEQVCPQHLEIRDLLEKSAEVLEK